MRQFCGRFMMLVFSTLTLPATPKLRHHSHYSQFPSHSLSGYQSDGSYDSNGESEDEGKGVVDCKEKKDEGELCDRVKGFICLNGSCQSPCKLKGMRRCKCNNKDDEYCYLCCGNSANRCRPAHELGIFRPNGMKWERSTCRNCLDRPDGLPCDDKDQNRLCKDGRCTANICVGRPEGEVCDMKKEKVCVDQKCVNTCSGVSGLLCECDDDPSSYQPSGDHCQLCCYDFRLKQCFNAFRQWGIKNAAGRPIARTGLKCGRYGNQQCNRYAVCAAQKLGSPDSFTYLFSSLLIAVLNLRFTSTTIFFQSC